MNDEQRRRNAEGMRRIRASRRAAGLCATCEAPWKGKTLNCDDCREALNVRGVRRRRERHERGLCAECGEWIGWGAGTLCPEHRRRFLDRKARFDERQRARVD